MRGLPESHSVASALLLGAVTSEELQLLIRMSGHQFFPQIFKGGWRTVRNRKHHLFYNLSSTLQMPRTAQHQDFFLSSPFHSSLSLPSQPIG